MRLFTILAVVIVSLNASPVHAQKRGQTCFKYDENTFVLVLRPISEGVDSREAQARLHLDRAKREFIEMIVSPYDSLFSYLHDKNMRPDFGHQFKEYLGHAVQCGNDEADELWAKYRETEDAARVKLNEEAAVQRDIQNQTAQNEKNRVAALPPTELDQAALQGALDRYLAEAMRLWSIANFGRDMTSVKDGRVYMLTISMRYQLTGFEGCTVGRRIGTCRANMSVRMRDEFNYGSSAIHRQLADAMEGMANQNNQQIVPNLAFKDGSWKIQVDPRALFQR